MRIFHLGALGETGAEMGRLDPPTPPERCCLVGLYACSPGEGSFEATFTEFDWDMCRWRAHAG